MFDSKLFSPICLSVFSGKWLSMAYFICTIGSSREKTDADLLRELETLLQPQVATAQRCKTLKELCESDRITRLADVSNFFACSLTYCIRIARCSIKLFALCTGDHYQLVRTHQGFDHLHKTGGSSSNNISILPEIGPVPIWRPIDDTFAFLPCDWSKWKSRRCSISTGSVENIDGQWEKHQRYWRCHRGFHCETVVDQSFRYQANSGDPCNASKYHCLQCRILGSKCCRHCHNVSINTHMQSFYSIC